MNHPSRMRTLVRPMSLSYLIVLKSSSKDTKFSLALIPILCLYFASSPCFIDDNVISIWEQNDCCLVTQHRSHLKSPPSSQWVHFSATVLKLFLWPDFLLPSQKGQGNIPNPPHFLHTATTPCGSYRTTVYLLWQITSKSFLTWKGSISCLNFPLSLRCSIAVAS